MQLKFKHAVALAVAIVGVLGGCASVSVPVAGESFVLDTDPATTEALLVRDGRGETAFAKVECEGAVRFNDSHFKPSPLRFVSQALYKEIRSGEWSATALKWLEGRDLILAKWEAVGGVRCARPVDTRGLDAMATMGPAGPAIGYLMQAIAEQAKRTAYVEIDIVIRAGDREFQAGALSTRSGIPPREAFQQIARETLRSIANQIAEESVGFAPVPRSGVGAQ